MKKTTQQYLDTLNIDPQLTGLAMLNAIQSAHVERFPFNSIAVLLKQDISIESQGVYEKIVNQKMGGYCFEHNKLAYDILIDLGFKVDIKLARVVYNKTIDVPRTHRVSIVTLNDEAFLFDVGFGHFGPIKPIKLNLHMEQRVGHECYRVTELENGALGLQIWKDEQFFTLYSFDANHYTEADCLTAHFYSHKFPQAGFVNNLVVSRKNRDQILSLRNGEMHVVKGGKTNCVPVDNVDHLHSLLTVDFELPIDQAISEYLYSNYSR